MKRMRFLKVLVLAAALLLCLSGCGKNYDGPPDPGTPEPALLDGTFVCDQGRFIFNGDGKSVTVEMEGDVAELLPAGEAEYYFKWYNFGLCRYDVATVLDIVKDGKSISLDVSSASETKIELKLTEGQNDFVLSLSKEG